MVGPKLLTHKWVSFSIWGLNEGVTRGLSGGYPGVEQKGAGASSTGMTGRTTNSIRWLDRLPGQILATSGLMDIEDELAQHLNKNVTKIEQLNRSV